MALNKSDFLSVYLAFLPWDKTPNTMRHTVKPWELATASGMYANIWSWPADRQLLWGDRMRAEAAERDQPEFTDGNGACRITYNTMVLMAEWSGTILLQSQIEVYHTSLHSHWGSWTLSVTVYVGSIAWYLDITDCLFFYSVPQMISHALSVLLTNVLYVFKLVGILFSSELIRHETDLQLPNKI